MRFKKTKLGKGLDYPLTILDAKGGVLAVVSLGRGVPKVAAKELKNIIDSHITNLSKEQ